MAIKTDRLRCYIAGPISKGCLRDNVNNATACFHRLRKAGLAPFCPAWSAFSGGCFDDDKGNAIATAGALPDGTTWEEWLEIDLPWTEAADAVLRLPGESRGADVETAHAEAMGVPVFTDEAALLEWAAEEVAARKEWEAALRKEEIDAACEGRY